MRSLERIYSRSERIVLRARFSGFAAAKLIIVAAVLGAIIALLWVYAPEIEGGLDPKFDGTVRYLTPVGLKWALLGAACFVIFLVICDAVSMYRQELIVTEDKFIFKQGVFKIRSVMRRAVHHQEPRETREIREEGHEAEQRGARAVHAPAADAFGKSQISKDTEARIPAMRGSFFI